MVPQPPLLSALAVVNKNLSRLSRQFLGNIPGDGLDIQGSFLRAEFKWVVAVVRLECDPLLGGVQGSVVADDVAQCPLEDEGLDGVRESLGSVSPVTVSVEKSVSIFQFSELLTDDASKSWTYSSAPDTFLRDTSDHEVDVVNFVINFLEFEPELLFLFARPLIPRGERSQSTLLPVAVVARQSVVPATLDVDRQQIFSKIFSMMILLEQMVCDL